VRCLVDRYGYLPFAAVDVLRHARFDCDLDSIMEEAVRVLTSPGSDAEALRGIIYAVAATGGLHGKDLHRLAPHAMLHVPKRGGTFRLLARLALLNFAGVPLEYHSVPITGKERSSPAAVPTITAEALLAKGLAGENPRSPMPEEVARLIVGFGFEARREVIRWLLGRAPRTVGDIVVPVKTMMEKVLERPEWVRAAQYRDFIRGPLLMLVLREALLAPYYLQHYGYIELDPLMYMLMWEVKRRGHPL